MKLMHLKDRVAIVTGSGRGIGRGIALELACHGANVVVADMRYELAQDVAGEIKGMGRQALAVSTDVTQRTQVKEMMAKAMEAFGKIDILVNNAGWDKIEPFVKSTEETWDKVIAINFKGVLYCVREVLDHMIERQYGKIISIGSDAGRVGSSGEAVYSGTKGAVIAFSKTLAREMARYKINVNVVCPGPSDTPLFAEIGQDNPKLVESLKRVIPWGRLGAPEDIAHAVAFLASDEAGFITGQTLSVSGGLTMC
jgi:2-hydroxycyclohexanecarboxyl-CoA dehydrogenase